MRISRKDVGFKKMLDSIKVKRAINKTLTKRWNISDKEFNFILARVIPHAKSQDVAMKITQQFVDDIEYYATGSFYMKSSSDIQNVEVTSYQPEPTGNIEYNKELIISLKGRQIIYDSVTGDEIGT